MELGYFKNETHKAKSKRMQNPSGFATNLAITIAQPHRRKGFWLLIRFVLTVKLFLF
jgi:hypothetical protein